MKSLAAKSPEASQLRGRKYELVRQFNLPEDLLGGPLKQTYRRCGKPNCRCVQGATHPMWSVTFCRHGKRRSERIPDEWLEEIEVITKQTKNYLEAVKEVMEINLELLAMTRFEMDSKKVRRRQKTAHLTPKR